MTQWGFFRFALSILAVVAGILLGIYLGRNNQISENREVILAIIEENSANDRKVRASGRVNKSDIVKRLQENIRNE